MPYNNENEMIRKVKKMVTYEEAYNSLSKEEQEQYDIIYDKYSETVNWDDIKSDYEERDQIFLNELFDIYEIRQKKKLSKEEHIIMVIEISERARAKFRNKYPGYDL